MVVLSSFDLNLQVIFDNVYLPHIGLNRLKLFYVQLD